MIRDAGTEYGKIGLEGSIRRITAEETIVRRRLDKVYIIKGRKKVEKIRKNPMLKS